MSISTNILSDLTRKAVIVGERYPGAGYHGTGHQIRNTIHVMAAGLKGRISLEASLVVDPLEKDWFPVMIDGEQYIEFDGMTGSRGFTVLGRFLWIRAKLDRRYLRTGSSDDEIIADSGILNGVLLK